MAKIEQVTLKLSNKLGNSLNKTEEERAVLNYGLFIFLHTTMAILATIFIGLVSGMFIEMLIISIVAALLKRYSGGVHSTTPERCLITGLILSFILSIFCKGISSVPDSINLIILMLIMIFSYYILDKKCPVPSKNKPLSKESTRKMLRKKAFILMNVYISFIAILIIIYLITNLITIKIIYNSICLGIVLQVIALTSIGDKLIKMLEKIFNTIKYILN